MCCGCRQCECMFARLRDRCECMCARPGDWCECMCARPEDRCECEGALPERDDIPFLRVRSDGTRWWPPGGVRAGIGCDPDRALSSGPGESVGVSRPGHGCLRVACLGSVAGLCGRGGLPFPGSLELELPRHITRAGVVWVGAKSL